MKRAVSRAQWIALAASVALAAGAVAARQSFPFGNSPVQAELAALQAEVEQLRGADDQTRDEWRRRVQDLRGVAWSEADLAAFVKRMGPAWKPTKEMRGPDSHLLRLEFSRSAVPLGAWPEFVRLIAELEARPGLRVVSLEIGAAGVGTRRRFTRMAFAVQVISSPGKGNVPQAVSLEPSSPASSSPSGSHTPIGAAQPHHPKLNHL